VLFRIAPLLLAASTVAAAQTPLTARAVIERIQKQVGVPWRAETVDTFKAGDPDTAVTGVATTMMATYDVLQRAAAGGKNLVISHEPVFYSHLDSTAGLAAEGDKVWAEKDKFIREHKMVVWRFHDHWHMMKPDGVMFGVTRKLGWNAYQDAQARNIFTVPRKTVKALALEIQTKLGPKALRVVGAPDLEVRRVALAPGAGGPAGHLKALRRDDVDVLVIGEVPEWETIEYVADAAAQGKRKALILIGHIESEQPGMEYCAEWLKGFVKEVPVGFVAAKDPFWQVR
jgi:putative NIF3 family GTP cyclohydrolase 1 type 2